MGAKDVKLYVNRNLIFSGKLDKGDREAPVDRSILVDQKNEKSERLENTVNAHSEESKGAHEMAGNGDKELGLGCSQPAETLVDAKCSSHGNVCGERMNATNCGKDSLSPLEEYLRLSAAPTSMGDRPSAPATSPPVRCPPVHEEPSLIQQLENLMGRKISEPPGKTPLWLQPSPTGKDRKQGGGKPKPLWLSPEKPLAWKGRLPSEDVISEGPGETEAGDKGPRSEPGSGTSRRVNTKERNRRATPKACSDDVDIFNEPPNREHPANCLSNGRLPPEKDRESELENSYAQQSISLNAICVLEVSSSGVSSLQVKEISSAKFEHDKVNTSGPSKRLLELKDGAGGEKAELDP
ncbi:hypothetical protein P7K49_023214 [Saguinus oedipus]|uniref:Uncharacterized protein n=1 Tax=Saguinus oedipus TaxID=9490 RepID=A0ABQ9UMK9_SAGOE|nr:hypothetical protein P7K49_023214 [Saguinus oedipus]